MRTTSQYFMNVNYVL